MAKKFKKEILRNKYLFYLMSVLATANLIYFYYTENMIAIILLISTGLIASLFLESKIVIIIISIFVANLFSCFGKEGFFSKKKTKKTAQKKAGSATADGESGGEGGNGGGEESTDDTNTSECEKFDEAKALRDEEREVKRLEREEKREFKRLEREEKREFKRLEREEKREAEEKIRNEQREATCDKQASKNNSSSSFL